jgi:hypothetical protein
MTDDRDYWYYNHFSQSERRQEVKRDHRDTFHSRAQAALDDESGGRFARLNPSKVTGAEPISQVPQQPPNSPYANPVPPGAAIDQLGFAIDEMEPVGSHAEIERSLQRLADADPGALISRADRVEPEAGGVGQPSRSPASPNSAATPKPFKRRF